MRTCTMIFLFWYCYYLIGYIILCYCFFLFFRACLMLCLFYSCFLYFWIIKILCTTVGETAADYLNMVLNFGLTGTSLMMSALLAVVMFFQFKAAKYIPSIYWLAVVLISIGG